MRRSPLIAVFLTVVIDLLGFGLVLPLLPLYADGYRASKLTVGLLFAAFSGMQFVFAPLWGRLSDRIGRRPVILVGLAGSAASYVLFALAELSPAPLTLLFVSRILAGFFGGTVTTALAYIADVTTEHERARGMALVGAAFGIGFTVGPVVGGLGHHYVGPLAPGFIAAGFSAFAFLFAAARLPEPPRHRSTDGPGWLRLGSLSRALRIPGAGLLLSVAFVATSAFAMFESTLALLANERFEGWNPEKNGWLFAYVGLWLILAQGWFVRRYIHRVGERRFIVIGCVGLAFGLVAIGLSESPLVLGTVSPIAIFAFAMITPSVASLLSRRCDPAHQGEMQGVNQSVQALARIVGPVLGNVLLGIALLLPYGVGAALMLAVFGLSLALLFERRLS
jgi:MFS family permease